MLQGIFVIEFVHIYVNKSEIHMFLIRQIWQTELDYCLCLIQ